MADPRPKPQRDDIKIEYITSDSTLRELAEKHGIKESTLIQLAVRNHWADMRKEHIESVTKETLRRQVASKVKELSEWNRGDLIIVKAMRSQIAEAITIAQKGKLNKDGTRDGRAKGSIPVREMQMLGSTLESLRRIALSAIGVSERTGKLDDEDERDEIASIIVNVKNGRTRATTHTE